MKKLLVYGSVFLTTLGLYSCSDNFKVAAPYKNITMVYGLMNTEDTAHYIIVKKAFMDENKNAVDIAKIPDSNYYPNLNVYVREISGSTVLKTITLKKVDLVNEGYVKDSGTFSTAPNYAYKFTDVLNPAYKYRLVVNNPDAQFTDSSEVQIIDGSQLNCPDFIPQFQFGFQRIKNSMSITCIVPSNAAYVEAAFRFKWADKNVATGVQTDHYADFKGFEYPGFPLSITGFSLKAPNSALYSFIKSSMGAAPENVERYIDSCDFMVAAAPRELYDYMVTLSIQSTGLTADQLKPIYTNILGKDAYGIFSSRANKEYKNFIIAPATLDSIIASPITQSCNIKGRTDH